MRTNRWLGWYGILLVASTGCWQEVHYKADKPLVLTPVVNDLPAEAGETQDEGSDPQAPPTIEPADARDNVTADELFGASEVGQASPDIIRERSQAEPDLRATDEPSPVVESEEPITETAVAPDEPVVTSSPTDSPTPEVMRPSKTAFAVWRMSSRWSFAAAIYAKGQPEDRYSDSLDQATYAAELVGLELPSFPVSEGMTLEAAVIGYLLDAGPAAFVNKLGEDYVPEYEALAELAIRTNALLLVYTPKSQQLDPLISSIRQASEKSGLPAELWTDLISMLERREPFADVKQQVLRFHTEVGDYLAGEE